MSIHRNCNGLSLKFLFAQSLVGHNGSIMVPFAVFRKFIHQIFLLSLDEVREPGLLKVTC